MYDPIVFDLDGTLVDTVALIRESHRHAVTTVLRKDLSDRELVAHVGRPLIEQMRVFSPDHADELYEVYRTWNHANTAAMIRTYDGIDAMLDELDAAGRTTAVVTSKSRDAVELAFDAIPGLRERFEVVICSEDTPKHKPNGDPILLALARLGAAPSPKACYVGDSPYDLQAARAAGVSSIAVTWGFFDAPTLAAEAPDAIVHLPSELRDILRS